MAEPEFIERRSGIDRRETNTMLNPDKEQRRGPDRRLDKRIEIMHINDGDVVIVRLKQILPIIKTTLEAISKHIQKQGAAVIFADHNTKIEKFNERKMYKLGWIRKDQLEDETVIDLSDRIG